MENKEEKNSNNYKTNTNTDNKNKENLIFKIVILGDSGVGKTSILHYYVFNKFKKDPKHTVTVEFSSKTINIGGNEIKLQLWDTAGQERFRSVTKSYYKGAIGVLIVYDTTKIDSFQHVSSWLSDAKNAARKDCSICLVGNKSDLKDQRTVSFNEAAKFSQDNSNIFYNYLDILYYDCSALSGENVEEAFNILCKNIIKKIEDGIISFDDNPLNKLKKPIQETNNNENSQDIYQKKCANC